MRLVIWLGLAVMPFVAEAQDAQDATRLLDAVVTTFGERGGLRFRGQREAWGTDSRKRMGTFDGTLFWRDGKYSFRVTRAGHPRAGQEHLLVFQNRTWARFGEAPARFRAQKAASTVLQRALAVAGPMLGASLYLADRDVGASDIATTEVALEGRDVQDEQAILRLKYKLRLGTTFGHRREAAVTLWVDGGSRSPVRRIVEWKDSGRRVRWIERYEAIKTPAGSFRMPAQDAER